MEKIQLNRTGRLFPSNLYNKLEEKLRNKSDKPEENIADVKTATVNEKTEDKNEIKCPKCGKMVNRALVVKKKYVCYECGGYFRVKTKNRIKMVADRNTFEPWFEDMEVSILLTMKAMKISLQQPEKKQGSMKL